jgi:cytochrome b6-f complex iron-sulfur subunit
MAEEKETTASEGKEPGVDRRSFINWVVTGWVAMSAALAAGATAVGRFMFPNVVTEPPSSFKVGFPADFAVGKVDERFKEKYRVWVVRNEEGVYALSAICTHLGCTPNWLEAENKFKCPCHGSGFYPTGINFEGPAPRPLERVKVSLAEDGQILVDKGRSFKWEAGQWEDPEAFLKLA